MIDVNHQINSVRREVGTRTLEAGEARTVVISQAYEAAIDDVWDACTNPERIPRWFLPVSGDLRLGGRYQLKDHAGGTIERCDPPKSFAATWEYGEDVSWIEVRLNPEPDGRTRLEIEHITSVGDTTWAQFGPGAVGIGWDSIFLGLGLHLTGGRSIEPAESAAWAASAEGKEFMALSSRRWCEANVAAGADRDEAQAAADRTIAAYTAPPEESSGSPESS
jgi:uncharacterized protein YndB with AHSA1/START domain